MATQTRSAVGRRIGGFVLEAFVEGGGPRAVYRARWADRPRARPVAVELLRTGSPSPEVARAFREEQRCLEALRHPAIPRCLGSGTTDDGWPWYATDFAQGPPLLRYAADRGLGLGRRIRLMIEMCRAVEHAHERGVLHRDLGPESLVVTPRGTPLVVGLGTEGTNTAGNVTALGWILYDLLDPVRPYLTVLRGGGPPPAGLRPRWRPRPRRPIDHVCLRAIAAGGRERYRSAGALADDLAAVLEGKKRPARPGGATHRLRRWIARLGSGRPSRDAPVARCGNNA